MSSDSRWNEPDEMQDETGDGIAFRIANGDVYIAFSSGGPSMAVVLGPQKQEEFAQLYVAACHRAAMPGQAEAVARATVPGVSG